MKKFIVVALLLCIVFVAQSQKKELKIEDAFNPAVYPDRMSMLWIPGGNDYSEIQGDSLLRKSIKGNEEEVILTLEDINEALIKVDLEKTKRIPSFQWLDANHIWFKNQGFLHKMNIDDKSINVINHLPKDGEGMEFAPETFHVAYTRGNNLYTMIRSDEIAVSDEENDGIKTGQTVHRSEFGIVDGIFWSPKGNLLAYYRKDETMVTDYPLVDIDTRIATVENTKYPMAGETSEEVQVGIFNPDTHKSVFLKTDDPKDTYFTNVTWSPDEKQIYIAQLNRDQNHMKLNVFDASSGDFIKTLFEEKHKKYVEPEHGPVFLPNDASKFLWYSERDGWNHLYLYNTEGKLLKQVTKGSWLVKDIVGFDDSGETVYLMTTKQSPLESHLYAVDINSGKMNQLTKEAGTHHVKISKDKNYFLDQYSSIIVPSKYQIIDTKGKVAKELLNSDEKLEAYNIGETELVELKANDGTILHGRLIKPYNLDPNKKHPVLIYVYGGPHAQMVTNSWLAGAGIWLNYMASQGYVVWTLDNRGSANRGFEFESAIFRNCGKLEVEDQMVGVEYLKSLPYVDPERIGVDGWSYGGFMTLSLMLDHPEVFKVGVAGGPVVDWKWYEVMYGERYMDTPQDNPEGYKNSSLLNKVKNMEENDRILVIHGTMDPTVVWQNSLSFVKQTIKDGKIIDYMVYPGHEHNVRGWDRIHMWKKITRYFDDYL